MSHFALSFMYRSIYSSIRVDTARSDQLIEAEVTLSRLIQGTVPLFPVRVTGQPLLMPPPPLPVLFFWLVEKNAFFSLPVKEVVFNINVNFLVNLNGFTTPLIKMDLNNIYFGFEIRENLNTKIDESNKSLRELIYFSCLGVAKDRTLYNT